MVKKQGLLILIKWDQPSEDWLDIHDVMKQAGVRITPLP